uniref:Uncharacterized protein n=1 Tax=Wuchereria bancrofti TaxID=6293 RepID=A0AAF5PJK2_WUCBA
MQSTSKFEQTDIIEGVLDIHLDKDGRIYKNNRPITRNDQDGASALSKLEGASKTENGEALATTVQMRTTLRCLLPLAAPSTAYFLFSRAYSNGRGFEYIADLRRWNSTIKWRIKHISLIRSLLNPMLFKYDYRIKRLKWYDGLTIFYVGEDGLVYRAVTRRTIDDEQKTPQANRLADLAQKVGVLPKGFEYIADLRRWNSTIKWRIKHISLIRSLLNPMLFKYDYRIKRTIDDEQKTLQANRLADLARWCTTERLRYL